MMKVLHWQGLQNKTTERCIIDSDEEDITVMGIVSNTENPEVLSIVYSIVINTNWQPVLVSLSGNVGDREMDEMYMRTEGNIWVNKGEVETEFTDCAYVDISLTPFTNTLPINRLQLPEGESEIIRVLYFDVLTGEVKAVEQKYTCIDKHHYKFENVPNDFEAIITVDDEGFVVSYPGLFERV